MTRVEVTSPRKGAVWGNYLIDWGYWEGDFDSNPIVIDVIVRAT